MRIAFILAILLSGAVYADFHSETIPYSFIGSKMDGMKITKSLPSNCGLSKLGVRKGDIVVDVDGVPIINQQAALEAYGNRSAKSAIVLRKGRQITLGDKS